MLIVETGLVTERLRVREIEAGPAAGGVGDDPPGDFGPAWTTRLRKDAALHAFPRPAPASAAPVLHCSAADRSLQVTARSRW
jgi:hypothetical protein